MPRGDLCHDQRRRERAGAPRTLTPVSCALAEATTVSAWPQLAVVSDKVTATADSVPSSCCPTRMSMQDRLRRSDWAPPAQVPPKGCPRGCDSLHLVSPGTSPRPDGPSSIRNAPGEDPHPLGVSGSEDSPSVPEPRVRFLERREVVVGDNDPADLLGNTDHQRVAPALGPGGGLHDPSVGDGGFHLEAFLGGHIVAQRGVDHHVDVAVGMFEPQ